MKTLFVISFFVCFGAFFIALIIAACNQNRENRFTDVLLKISGTGLIASVITLIGCGIESINF